jgi:hypothetical protein
MRIFLGFLLIVSTLLFCSKETENDTLATIGNKKVSREQYETFRKVIRMYPTSLNPHFPGQRSMISFMLETDAIYSKSKTNFAKGSIRSSDDWKWKKRYYPAQVYILETLVQNLGATEKEINDYYLKNKETFKKTVVVDSTGKDSSYYEEIAAVKGQISETLFLEKNKPDSEFLSRFDSLPDQNSINSEWIYTIKSNVASYFMKKIYQEKYGTPYPDSLDQILGNGKAITPEDMEVILTWIPQERISYYDNPHGKKELAEWLLKWKLFSEKADEIGLSKSKEIKSMMDWAWKIDVADRYVNNRLIPAAQASVKLDSSMLIYSIYDERGMTSADTQSISTKAESFYNSQIESVVDSLIFEIRKDANIQFTQNDLRDDKDKNPSDLLRQADSLRDTGSVDEAERIYSTLTRDFIFVSEGKKALAELAKIQMERQLYSQAISNYRKYLLLGADEAKKCNTFFMIGFIYDEYLDRPNLAEVNYKWVLKNSPDCELADDAEFMMLHLGEPMSSVEELQAEALRQGRKVEPFEEDTMEMEPTVSENL